MSQKSIEELSYEQAYAELEELLSVLEADDAPLEELLAKFERGQALARHCLALLDKAELRVRQISGEEVADFEPQA
ncbi:MAG: exodeoxyribonuclease VII small subunit [Anaerolineae bacterium]|nr:MAG: exodeoxyribonuclease VII small subunit [Anaerolineae bacterium]